MHTSEWSSEYLSRKEAYLESGYKAVVVSNSGYKLCLVQDSGISDVRWMGDAVVVSFRNGTRMRYYGPYGSQRESL